jgi:predicted dehydrogenase
MQKVKLGFIGLGHVGQIAHLKNYLYDDSVVVSGICDSRQDLVKKVGELYAIENCTSNADQLINDPNIDALVIVVDRGSVFSLCKKALKAKKHVFTEKPMALNTDDATKLVNIAKENKVVYKIGFMRKYDTGISSFVTELKNLINDNSLGRLSLLRIHAFDSVSSYAGGYDSTLSDTEKIPSNPLDQVPGWIPENKKFDYLNTLNVYCHHLNLLHAIFDDSFTFNVNYVNFQNRHCRIVNLTIEKNKKSSEIILELGHIPAIVHDEYIEASFEGGTYRVDFPPNMLRDGTAQTTLNTYSSETQSIQKKFFQFSWSFRNQAKDFIEDIQNLRYAGTNSGSECIRDMVLHDKLWKQEIDRSKND